MKLFCSFIPHPSSIIPHPSIMNRFRRSILWFALLVVVPLGALTIMQYRFLRSLQKTTAEAERNWLRSSVEEVTREIESNYRTACDRALTVSSATLTNTDELSRHLRGTSVPGA